MVNIEDLSAAHGLEYFFSGLGYVPGPFIAGKGFNYVKTEIVRFHGCKDDICGSKGTLNKCFRVVIGKIMCI